MNTAHALPLDIVVEESTSASAASWRVEVLRPSRHVRLQRPSRRPRATRDGPDYRVRALALWPRLDAEKLRRTRGDVMRIARLVERRTSCSIETIVGMLMREAESANEG